MTDHPVFVPTRAGRLGGVVTDPGPHAIASAVVLEGIGGRRFGVNRLWARTASALADLGMVVFRIDYPGKGESVLARDRGDLEAVVADAVGWFRDRAGDLPLHVVGACLGARPAVALTLARDARVCGLTLVSPHLGPAPPRSRGVLAWILARRPPRTADPMADGGSFWRDIQAAANKTRTVIVAGSDEKAIAAMMELAASARGAGADLHVDVVADLVLHGHSSLRAQEETVLRVTSWAAAAIGRSAVTRERGSIRAGHASQGR